MKALSLMQPWAWLVSEGHKRIENRSWSTKYRGLFLIHASKGMTKHQYDAAVEFSKLCAPDLVLPPRGLLERGGIVGKAMLADVIPPCPRKAWPPTSPKRPCEHLWHMEGQYGFVLKFIEPIPFVPMKGMLGFFEVEWPERVAYLDENGHVAQGQMVLPSKPLDSMKFYTEK